MKILALLLLSAFSVLILGCQGIPLNSSAPAPEPPGVSASVSGQAEPLRAAAVLPSPGADCIPENTVVTAAFNKAVNPATVNAGTFFIQGVSGTVAYDARNFTATFSPANALQANTSYSVAITTGIADSNGVHLPGSFQSSFTTGPCNQAHSAEFVYVANLGSAHGGGSISGFAVNQQTGGLAPVPGSPFPADSPAGITSDPSGQHVFVIEKKFSLAGEICSQVKGMLLSENIDSHSGKLRLADKVTLNGSCPQNLAVDQEGKTLYVSEETSSTGTMLDGGEVQAFAIGQNGALREIPGSPFPVSGGAGALAIHPGGKLLYVVGGEGIVVFDRDQETGRLASARAVAVRPEAHLAIVPSGRLMIAENASIIDQVTLFSIDLATGGLTPQPPMASSLPRAVAVDPFGEFAALAVASPDTIGLPGVIQIFRIDDSTSTMTRVPGTPIAAGNGPFDVKFDPQGRLVYSVATNDNSIAGFMFDRSSGSLIPVPGSPFKAGDAPMELTIASPK